MAAFPQAPAIDGRSEEAVGLVAVGEQLVRAGSEASALHPYSLADSIYKSPGPFLLGCKVVEQCLLAQVSVMSLLPCT